MKRKILSLILVFAMTVSLFTVGTGAVEPTYGDTAGHWAESSIERWSAYGIIQGSNGQFDPNGQLTCAQLATILAKLLKLPAAKDAGFTDNTADAWYYDAINRCAAAGILNGNGDGTVTPEAPITRERAMVMLARALGIEPIRKPDLTKYTDAAQVSAYAQGYVAALIEAGIVGGVTADELAPQANINRASTVTILDRAISTYADQAGATVKVDGKGIVLVVAENVKITGAPEGTKIVVADGATGLTVNGKSVSDDQTYIVPKATTGSGSSSSGGYSHSHSYDTTTHKCSCGEFDPAVVATIGDETGYLTLKEAVAAATSGQIVKLVKDCSGNGIKIESGTVTIDLNGKTYTVDSMTVGSTGTETNAFQFLKGSTVTIKNGKMGVTSDLRCAYYFQNYANLTLENVEIVIDNCRSCEAAVHTMNGVVNIMGSTSIKASGEYFWAPNDTGARKAIMVNDWIANGYVDGTQVTVDTTGVIEGNVLAGYYAAAGAPTTGKSNLRIINGTFNGTISQESTSGSSTATSLVIIGGTFSSDPSAYVPVGYVATKSEPEEIWTVGEGSTPLVAEINGVKYISLPAALAAAKNGDTVKLVANETVDSTISVNKNLKLDLGGKTLTGTSCRALHITGGKLELTGSGTVTSSTGIDVRSSVIRVGDNTGGSRTAELVIGKDVVIEAPASYGVGAFGTVTTETLTIYGTVKSTTATNESYDGCAVTTLGTDTTTPATITIKEGAVISAEHTNAVYLPAGTLIVEGGTITGTTGIYFKSTNMTISGGTITGNGAAQNYEYYGNGGISTGEAVTIDSCNYPGGVGSVVISGGTFTSANADAVGSYNSEGGTKQTNFITGGTFSSDPSAYVAEGYITLVNGDGTFTVSNTDEIPVTTATVQDYLDGKYGSINGKTLVLGEGTYNKIEFGRATAYKGSNTEYYRGGNTSTVDEIKQDIKNHPNGGAGNRVYVRNMSDVTLKAADGAAVTINGLVAFGGQVNSTKWYSRDFVADRPMSATENNNICYWIGQNWSNITFEGLTFTDGVNIEAYGNDKTNIDNVRFDNCQFSIVNNGNETYCIRLNVDGNVAKANNLIVAECVFTNGLTAVLTDGMPNVTVTDSTFSGLVRHAINPLMENSGAPGYGRITVTGNTFKNMSTNAEKGTILRMGEVGADAVFTIQNNTATEGITLANSIKVNSLADGIKYNISGNNWGSLEASDSKLDG